MSAHKWEAFLFINDVERLSQLRLWKDECKWGPSWPFSFTKALLGARHSAAGHRNPEERKEFPLNESSLFIFGVTVQVCENCNAACAWIRRCGLSSASCMLVFVIEHISRPVLLYLISGFARKSFRILTSLLCKPSVCSSTHLPLDCLTTCLLATRPSECGVLLCKLFRSIEHKVLVRDFGKRQLKSTANARCSVAPAVFSE